MGDNKRTLDIYHIDYDYTYKQKVKINENINKTHEYEIEKQLILDNIKKKLDFIYLIKN